MPERSRGRETQCLPSVSHLPVFPIESKTALLHPRSVVTVKLIVKVRRCSTVNCNPDAIEHTIPFAIIWSAGEIGLGVRHVSWQLVTSDFVEKRIIATQGIAGSEAQGLAFMLIARLT